MNQIRKIQDLYELNHLKDAEEQAWKELDIHTENPDLHFLLGKIYYKKQEWGRAINQFRRVLEIDPEYPEAKEQIEMANTILGYFTPDMFNP